MFRLHLIERGNFHWTLSFLMRFVPYGSDWEWFSFTNHSVHHTSVWCEIVKMYYLICVSTKLTWWFTPFFVRWWRTGDILKHSNNVFGLLFFLLKRKRKMRKTKAPKTKKQKTIKTISTEKGNARTSNGSKWSAQQKYEYFSIAL